MSLRMSNQPVLHHPDGPQPSPLPVLSPVQAPDVERDKVPVPDTTPESAAE
jgi:hypothetical protein